MFILVNILIVIDLLLLGVLPFAFLAKTGRTIYKSKPWYILSFIIWVTGLITIQMFFANDIITIACCTLLMVIIGQILFSRGKGALFYQIVYIMI